MKGGMIERAARALCKFDGHAENIKFDGKPMWASYIDQARCVILAMREPTERINRLDGPWWPVDDGPSATWRTMIDAALAEDHTAPTGQSGSGTLPPLCAHAHHALA